MGQRPLFRKREKCIQFPEKPCHFPPHREEAPSENSRLEEIRGKAENPLEIFEHSRVAFLLPGEIDEFPQRGRVVRVGPGQFAENGFCFREKSLTSEVAPFLDSSIHSGIHSGIGILS